MMWCATMLSRKSLQELANLGDLLGGPIGFATLTQSVSLCGRPATQLTLKILDYRSILTDHIVLDIPLMLREHILEISSCQITGQRNAGVGGIRAIVSVSRC